MGWGVLNEGGLLGPSMVTRWRAAHPHSSRTDYSFLRSSGASALRVGTLILDHTAAEGAVAEAPTRSGVTTIVAHAHPVRNVPPSSGGLPMSSQPRQ